MCVGETKVVQGAVRTRPGRAVQRWQPPPPPRACSQRSAGLTGSSCLLRLEVVEAVTLTKHRWGSFVDQSQNGPVSAR